MVLQKPSSAGLGATLAVNLLSLHLVDNISIIPTELLSSRNMALSKKCDPWETEIVGVDEAVLDENIGSARMIKVAANVANDLGVHDVDILLLTEELARRGVLRFVHFLILDGCRAGRFGRFLLVFVPASRLPVAGLRRYRYVFCVKRTVRFLVRRR